MRVHTPDHLPILEDVFSGELVRLPNLEAIPDELRRRLRETDEIAVDPYVEPGAPPQQRA